MGTVGVFMANGCQISLLSPAVGTGNVGDYFIEYAIRRLLRDDVVYHRFTIRRPLTAAEIDQINATDFAVLCGTNVDQPVQIAVLRGILAALPPEQVLFAVHEDYDARLVPLLDLPRGAVFHSERFEDYVHLYTDPDHVVLALRLHAGMLGLANGLP